MVWRPSSRKIDLIKVKVLILFHYFIANRIGPFQNFCSSILDALFLSNPEKTLTLLFTTFSHLRSCHNRQSGPENQLIVQSRNTLYWFSCDNTKPWFIVDYPPFITDNNPHKVVHGVLKCTTLHIYSHYVLILGNQLIFTPGNNFERCISRCLTYNSFSAASHFVPTNSYLSSHQQQLKTASVFHFSGYFIIAWLPILT